MNKSAENRKPLPFETTKSKDQLRHEIAASLTPEQRLARLNEMIRFNKQFSPNYRKAFEKRLYEDDAFILK